MPIVSDTDSVYIHAEPLLKFLYKDFDNFSEKKKDEVLENVALQYQDIITKDYDRLAKECFNLDSHKLEMKTECVIRSAYFRKTRRYAQWITKQDGIIKKDFVDIKGLEFKKSNFPPVFGKFFEKILKQVLKGVEKEVIISQIKVFKKSIIKGEIPLTQLGNPTSVKTHKKYTGRKPRAGEIFTNIEKKASASVKAAIRYNDLLKFWGLDKQNSYITSSDKIKWIYLNDNPYKVESIAYISNKIPDKNNDFIEKYANRKKVFESILLNKLEGFMEDIGWEFNLNPHIDVFEIYEI